MNDPRDKSILTLFALVALTGVLSFIAGVYHTPKPKPDPDCIPFETERVIDGDTLVTESGTTLRLARIDAPELASKIEPSEPGAHDAKDYLQSLSFVGTCYERQSTGYYGRTIAEIKVNASDLMLKSGHADYYQSKPKTR